MKPRIASIGAKLIRVGMLLFRGGHRLRTRIGRLQLPVFKLPASYAFRQIGSWLRLRLMTIPLGRLILQLWYLPYRLLRQAVVVLPLIYQFPQDFLGARDLVPALLYPMSCLLTRILGN
jgi:hypothetical protein